MISSLKQTEGLGEGICSLRVTEKSSFPWEQKVHPHSQPPFPVIHSALRILNVLVNKTPNPRKPGFCLVVCEQIS